MTASRELVPAQTALARSMPSRGELLRVLRRLRALCDADVCVRRDAARAYELSHALRDCRVSHRIDLQL
jgi:hypothetical protein